MTIIRSHKHLVLIKLYVSIDNPFHISKLKPISGRYLNKKTISLNSVQSTKELNLPAACRFRSKLSKLRRQLKQSFPHDFLYNTSSHWLHEFCKNRTNLYSINWIKVRIYLIFRIMFIRTWTLDRTQLVGGLVGALVSTAATEGGRALLRIGEVWAATFVFYYCIVGFKMILRCYWWW